ncbi:hypothetical protein D0T49_01475 [Paludibacter sp. 221]|uniref:hypothetical protein n=1 Tax=Paludibacter sp. 221 TaxID=2302939 RepID=UPI0013D5729F|nr:hypothetical protein [Paludibacter sp. 221]NDV45720.1 hypothetical protein [Paludibacter sp. 221]
MRKTLFLFVLIITAVPAYCQLSYFSATSIPVRNGKVEFRVDFDLPLDNQDIRNRIVYYLKNDLNPYSGVFLLDNDNHAVFRTTDYLVVSSEFVSVFSVYMTYRIVFEYQENKCVAIIRDITFMDKEEFETKEKVEAREKRKVNMPEYTAEDIMIKKKYKVLLIPQASKKITESAVVRINEIFKDIDAILSRRSFDVPAEK